MAGYATAAVALGAVGSFAGPAAVWAALGVLPRDVVDAADGWASVE
jgi:hypothetical protein